MRVLWISPNGGNYDGVGLKGTGGWIPSLQSALSLTLDVELGIAFIHATDNAKVVRNETTYYPIKRKNRSNISKLISRYTNGQKKEESSYVRSLVSAIKDFQPNIIHIWGVENYYSCVVQHTTIPCIVHIQGIATSCVNAYVPPLFSLSDLKKADGFVNRVLKRGLFFQYQNLVKRAENEQDVCKYVKYYMGRTQWDRETITIMSPNSTYFHCDEILRNDFEGNWQYRKREKLIIHSTIGDVPYKGIDIVLKTAKVLKKFGIDFVWNVCGISTNSSWVNYCSKRFDVTLSDVNVILHGSVSGDVLKKMLLESDVYVHSSYIDNSPNSVAEAQLLGVPIVAMNVGGLGTMLENNSGILVQANDPWAMAYSILEMQKEETAVMYSENAKKEALKRHNKETIVSSLITTYIKRINDNEKN